MKTRFVPASCFNRFPLLFCILLSVLFLPRFAQGQPIRASRPFSEILRDLESNELTRTEKAIEELPFAIGGGLGQAFFTEEQLGELLRTDDLLPRLGKLLDNKNDRVRSSTMYIVAWLGLAAQDLSPKISRLLNDRNSSVETKNVAFMALCRMTPEAESVLEQIEDIGSHFKLVDLESLEGESNEPQVSLGSQLVTLGVLADLNGSILRACGHTTSEIPVLEKIATSAGVREVRVFSLYMLAVFGLEARAALPRLSELLADGDAEIRRVAAGTILAIERDRKRVVELADKLGLENAERDTFVKESNSFLDHFDESANEVRIRYLESKIRKIQYLEELLTFGRGPDKRTALREILEIGEPIDELRLAIMFLQDDRDPETRFLVNVVIKQFDSSD